MLDIYVKRELVITFTTTGERCRYFPCCYLLLYYTDWVRAFSLFSASFITKMQAALTASRPRMNEPT